MHVVPSSLVSQVVNEFFSRVERETIRVASLVECMGDVGSVIGPHLFSMYDVSMRSRIAASGYDHSTAVMMGDLLSDVVGDATIRSMMDDEEVSEALYDTHEYMERVLPKEIARKFGKAVNKVNSQQVYELKMLPEGSKRFQSVGSFSKTQETKMTDDAVRRELFSRHADKIEDMLPEGVSINDLFSFPVVRSFVDKENNVKVTEYGGRGGVRYRILSQMRPIFSPEEISLKIREGDDALQEVIHDMFVYYRTNPDAFKRVLSKTLTKKPPRPLKTRDGRVFEDLPLGQTWLLPMAPSVPKTEISPGTIKAEEEENKRRREFDPEVMSKLKENVGSEIPWVMKSKFVARGDQLYLDIVLPTIDPNKKFTIAVPSDVARDIKDRGSDAPYHFRVVSVDPNRGVVLEFSEQLSRAQSSALDIIKDPQEGVAGIGLDKDQIMELVKDLITDYGDKVLANKDPSELIEQFSGQFLAGGTQIATPESLQELINQRQEAPVHITTKSDVLPKVLERSEELGEIRRRQMQEIPRALLKQQMRQRTDRERVLKSLIESIVAAYPERASFDPSNEKTFGLSPLLQTKDGMRWILTMIMDPDISDFLFSRKGEIKWDQLVREVMLKRPDILEDPSQMRNIFGIRSMENFLSGVKVVALQKMGLSKERLEELVKKYNEGKLRVLPEDSQIIRSYLSKAASDAHVGQLYGGIMKKLLKNLTNLYNSGDPSIRKLFSRAPELREHIKEKAPAKVKKAPEKKDKKPETVPDIIPSITYEETPAVEEPSVEEEWRIFSSDSPMDMTALYRNIMAFYLGFGSNPIDMDKANNLIRMVSEKVSIS